MKILLSAYACEPHRGSEPAVGWNWASQAAKLGEAWVITRANNRPVIERALADTPVENLHFEYLDLPGWASFWKRGGRGMRTYYAMWQKAAGSLARKLHKQHHFDVAHHVTFGASYLRPGIATLPVPFVWGPIGMDPLIPNALHPMLDGRTIRHNWLRQAVYAGTRFNPGLVQAQQRASVLIPALPVCDRLVVASLRKRIMRIPQIQIAERELAGQARRHPSREGSRPIRILSSGRLVSKKGFTLTLKVFARLSEANPAASLTVTGDGPLRRKLERQAEQLGISKCVNFTGKLSGHRDVIKQMDNSDVFLFPTFEAGGMAAVEAMARGLPVVAMKFGGPGFYVDSHSGFLAEPDQNAVQAMGDALTRLSQDADHYESLSDGALERVRSQYRVEDLPIQLEEIYRRAITG